MTPTITDILSAPLDPNWTMDGLAERVLNAIAALPTESEQEFVIAVDDTTDRQVRRLIRPLLACLATKSASETGVPVNLYGGHFSFQRPGPAGPVWVIGDFENQPGCVRVALRRANLEAPMDASLISSDPAVMMGKPVVAGTRLTVEFILEELAAGTSVGQLIASHPRLTPVAVSAALAFAAQALRADVVYPTTRRSA